MKLNQNPHFQQNNGKKVKGVRDSGFALNETSKFLKIAFQ